MEKSFRDILSGFLEEKDPTPPVRASEIPSEVSFFWQAPRLNVKVKHPYLRAGIARLVKPEPPPVEVETVISLSQLSENDRILTQTLVTLGASELAQGISEKRLKKAHRRLAKRLHPDRGGEPSVFMKLQEAYEGLSASLKAL